MTLYLSNLFYCLMQTALTACYFETLFPETRTAAHLRFLLCTGCAACLYAISSALIYPEITFPLFWLPASALLATVYCGTRLKHCLFHASMLTAVYTISYELTILCIWDKLWYNPFYLQEMPVHWRIVFFSILFSFFILLVLIRLLRPLIGAETFTPSTWTFFIIIPFLYYSKNVFVPEIYQQSFQNLVITVFSPLSCLIMAIAIVIISEYTVKKDMQRWYHIASTAETRKELNSYQLSEASFTKMRQMAHDFQNHLNVITGLLSERDYPSLENYLQNLNGSILTHHNKPLSENPYLNQLLLQTCQNCKKNKIDFYVDAAELGLKHLSPEDTVALFSNLLDNAFEAAFKCSNPYIDLIIREEAAPVHELYISLRNSCSSPPQVTAGGLFLTNKENPELHGIGWYSIRQVLKRYDADWRAGYSETSGEFRVSIRFQFAS